MNPNFHDTRDQYPPEFDYEGCPDCDTKDEEIERLEEEIARLTAAREGEYSDVAAALEASLRLLPKESLRRQITEFMAGSVFEALAKSENEKERARWKSLRDLIRNRRSLGGA